VKNSVCVADGVVYAASVAGTIYALDAANGAILWTRGLGDDDPSRWDTAAPKVADGVVYAGRGPRFAALDAKTGAILWSGDPGLDSDWWVNVYAAPAISADRIYFGSNKGLFALDRATGKQIWAINETSSSPALVGDTLYCRLGSDLGAVNPLDGSIRWRVKGAIGDETGCPAATPGPDGRVYIGGANGRMAAFCVVDGRLVADFAVGRGLASKRPYQRNETTISSSPVLAGDLLIFGGTDGNLYVLDATTLQERQRINLGAPIAGPPAISGNAVFVPACDGNVYALAEVTRSE
jgi:outer membrane protein assembly factor BamB